MANTRRYGVYRSILGKMGLTQLDVYRYKDHEVIRVRDSSGRVLSLRLPRFRDEMKPEEFEDIVRKLYSEATGASGKRG